MRGRRTSNPTWTSTGGSTSPATPTATRRKISRRKPVVYFGSFQDLLGRDAAGNIKPKNEWLHKVKWDLVVFDEYHFGAWRETAKELFEGEEEAVAKKEAKLEYASGLEDVNEDLSELSEKETEFLPITTKAYLYLSGTPFRALATGEFIEEQIFNWTYTDEQRAKEEFAAKNPGKWNPYGALPQMRLLTYQMPDELLAIASAGEFDEFDLNAFFEASGTGAKAQFKHKSDVQKWLDIIRGGYAPKAVEYLKTGTRPPFPYSDVRLLPYLQHSFWFLPNVAACHAMANLLAEKHNTFWHDYEVVVAAGASAGIGLDALPPVRKAIGSGFETKTITLSCGKLTTGVTVPQWSSILMLRNLKSPETYFQAAFRVQSPWSIKNPNGDNPNEEEILKPVCFVFDFAPTRALRQLSEYGIGLSPNEPNPENAVKDLVSFLPVLAYDGANMTQIDAGGILDIAMAGTSATLLARKWESALLVNVDNDTLRRILDNPEAMAAVERIEGWRSLGDNIIETIINKSEKVKELKNKAKDKRSDGEGEEAAHRGGEGVQVQAQARPGEADQVRDAHPGVHVPDRLPREHAAGCHHQAGTGLVPGRHRPDGEGLPPARATQGVQHRADEPGRVRLPALRRCVAPLHRHRQPPGADALRAVRHRGGEGVTCSPSLRADNRLQRTDRSAACLLAWLATARDGLTSGVELTLAQALRTYAACSLPTAPLGE